jgi:acyl-CoA synthetase (AMP-forming)/AMP-acid ligase II
MEEITQPREAVGAATIAEAFRITAADRADEVAVRTKGDEVAWTWAELRERVDALAAGLTGLGLKRGDTVALLFGNRPEFHLSDLAVVTAGATPFSIYMQYGPEQIRYVVTDAGARMIITEQKFLDNVLEARKELPNLEHVIVIDGEAPEGVVTLDEVVAAPDPDFDAEASVAQLGPQDLLTITRPAPPGRPRACSSRIATCWPPSSRPSSSSSSRATVASSRGCPPPTSPSATRTTTCRSSTGCR